MAWARCAGYSVVSEPGVSVIEDVLSFLLIVEYVQILASLTKEFLL